MRTAFQRAQAGSDHLRLGRDAETARELARQLRVAGLRNTADMIKGMDQLAEHMDARAKMLKDELQQNCSMEHLQKIMDDAKHAREDVCCLGCRRAFCVVHVYIKLRQHLYIDVRTHAHIIKKQTATHAYTCI